MRAYGSKRKDKCRVPGHDRLGAKHNTWCDPAAESWHDDVVADRRGRKKRARRQAKKDVRDEA